jgi:hypothetical protein
LRRTPVPFHSFPLSRLISSAPFIPFRLFNPTVLFCEW